MDSWDFGERLCEMDIFGPQFALANCALFCIVLNVILIALKRHDYASSQLLVRFMTIRAQIGFVLLIIVGYFFIQIVSGASFVSAVSSWQNWYIALITSILGLVDAALFDISYAFLEQKQVQKGTGSRWKGYGRLITIPLQQKQE